MLIQLLNKPIRYLNKPIRYLYGLPRWLSDKESACRRHEFVPWIGTIPWRRKWQPTTVFLPGKSHGQRSLASYSPWSCNESDMTQQLNNNNKGVVAYTRQLSGWRGPRWVSHGHCPEGAGVLGERMGPPSEEVILTKQEGWETSSEVQVPLNLILSWELEEFELGSLGGLVKFSRNGQWHRNRIQDT